MQEADHSSATQLGLLDSIAAATLLRQEARLPLILSVIAGMVDLSSFLMLGKTFSAHITGNLVVVAAALVSGEAVNPTQALALPMFMLAVAAAWGLGKLSGKHGSALARRLLLLHFVLLSVLLVFAVMTSPYDSPHGLMAGIAVMIAVAAMACQFTLFRMALPGAVSTAVMTGNLSNLVLALLERWTGSTDAVGAAANAERLKRSLQLLMGFVAGCVMAAIAVHLFKDWAWALPALLAGVALFL